MAAINFPNSPSNGTTHTANGITWTYNSSKGVWQPSTFADAPQGEKGQKGQKGDKGQKGQKGEAGSNGSKGQKGEVGGTGSKGQKGEVGATGATPSGNVTFDNVYANDWFRNNNSGEGLYNQATGQHWYSDDDDYWNVAGGTGANGIRFRDESGGTIRGYLYVDQSNNMGFLNSAGEWSLRCHIPDGESPNIYFEENANTTWSGDAGSDEGKIEYHSDRFYINAGTNANRICQFRKGATDVSYVDNSGVYNGTATAARWSDLAERYRADAIYEKGTVMGIGGDAEVTKWQDGMPYAGVISTQPGVMMNNDIEVEEVGSEKDLMNPYIALTGRVPVFVEGDVKKGDMLVPAGDGKAKRTAKGDNPHSTMIIGFALYDSVDGMVEVKV